MINKHKLVHEKIKMMLGNGTMVVTMHLGKAGLVLSSELMFCMNK